MRDRLAPICGLKGRLTLAQANGLGPRVDGGRRGTPLLDPPPQGGRTPPPAFTTGDRSVPPPLVGGGQEGGCPYSPKSNRPGSAPSSSNNRRFIGSPPAYPVSAPFAPITRWQGITTPIGLS